MTLGSLVMAPPLPALLAGALALGMGGWSATPILFSRGRHAVRSFVWAADGAWRLQRADQTWERAELLPATATLGPWILLVWRVAGSRHYALIDVWEAGTPVFRALLGRLKLEAGSRRAVAF